MSDADHGNLPGGNPAGGNLAGGNPAGGNPAGGKPKRRIFLTLEPEKRLSKWFLGVGTARNTAQTVRQFQDTMLHGDEKHRYWTASVSRKTRDRLARRVRTEALIYIGIGLLLGGSAFVNCVSDGLSGHVSSGLFWLFMGLLASLIGCWVGTVKFWQAHNVRQAAHISLLEFMKHRSQENAHGG